MTGELANFSYIYVGSRPKDILGLSTEAEAVCSQFIGFSGKAADGTPKDTFILVTEATSVDLTLFSNVPIGTIILTPRVTGVFCYQRVAQATPGVSVNTDWRQVAKASV